MSLGIPYMGSKRKLAPEILKFIMSRHQNVTDFYDLCGGGGSVSFNGIKMYKNINFHYNELNSHIYNLVNYLKENKTLDPKFYEWVTREVFNEQINRTDADWYSGYVMTCWAFGNNSEKGYMYGKEIENIKRLGHEIVVNCSFVAMQELGISIPELFDIKNINQRRLVFCNYIKKFKTILEDNRVQNLELVEHLSRIQNLQNIQNIQNIQTTNLSYEKVIVTGENPILYVDKPYIGTEEYKENAFDHEKFYDWASDIEYPVYVSEYESSFEEVMAFKHRSSMSATNNKKKTIEKIFWNGKGDICKTTLF